MGESSGKFFCIIFNISLKTPRWMLQAPLDVQKHATQIWGTTLLLKMSYFVLPNIHSVTSATAQCYFKGIDPFERTVRVSNKQAGEGISFTILFLLNWNKGSDKKYWEFWSYSTPYWGLSNTCRAKNNMSKLTGPFPISPHTSHETVYSALCMFNSKTTSMKSEWDTTCSCHYRRNKLENVESKD